MKTFPFFRISCSLLLFSHFASLAAQEFPSQPEKQAAADSDPQALALAKVRELVFPLEEMEPEFFLRNAVQEPILFLADSEALEEVVGAELAKSMAKGIDFAQEQIVQINWQTGGPPLGTLKYELQGEDNKQKLLFYVQGPAGNGPRGRMLMMNVSFFVLPKELSVSLEQGERPSADAQGAEVEGGGGALEAAPGVEFHELELDMPQLPKLKNDYRD